jgi:hypothetical protein
MCNNLSRLSWRLDHDQRYIETTSARQSGDLYLHCPSIMHMPHIWSFKCCSDGKHGIRELLCTLINLFCGALSLLQSSWKWLSAEMITCSVTTPRNSLLHRKRSFTNYQYYIVVRWSLLFVIHRLIKWLPDSASLDKIRHSYSVGQAVLTGWQGSRHRVICNHRDSFERVNKSLA